MYETAEDLAELQELLDRTFSRMNPHMAAIVKPERRLSAQQVVTIRVEPSSMWSYSFHPERYPGRA